jgi:hypothetical protein
MAHYAWLDENNVVVNVTVGIDEDVIQDGIGGSTDAWEDFYSVATGYNIKRTSYNGTIRYNYAGIGYTYDPIDDAFIAPIPCDHSELLLNDLKRWECATCEANLMQSRTTA